MPFTLAALVVTGDNYRKLIRSKVLSLREGIKPGALLIVDYGTYSVDGSSRGK